MIPFINRLLIVLMLVVLAGHSQTSVEHIISSRPVPTQRHDTRQAPGIQSATLTAFPLDELVIALADGQDSLVASDLARSVDGQVVAAIKSANVYRIKLQVGSAAHLEQALTQLGNNKKVLLITPNFYVDSFGDNDLSNLLTCRSDLEKYLRGYKQIRLLEAYDVVSSRIGVFSPVTIGIVDTGINRRHIEFSGVDTGRQSIVSPDDLVGHGTSVAGIIGANNLGLANACVGINGQGQTQMNGIVSGLPIPYTLRVRGFGLLTVFELASDVDALGKDGIPVVNVSMGVRSGTPLALALGGFAHVTALLKNVISSHPNTLYIVAAGEDDIDASNVTPANLGGPSGLPNVITVAATDPANDRRANTPAGFGLVAQGPSNWGPTIDLAAPGKDIYAPGVMARRLIDPFATLITSAPVYVSFNGTSASAPIVSGSAAILKAIEHATSGYTLSPPQIKELLIAPADGINVDKPIGTCSPNMDGTYHCKRLNVCRSVKSAQNIADPSAPELLTPPSTPPIVPGSIGSCQGTGYQIQFGWSDVAPNSCNIIDHYEFKLLPPPGSSLPSVNTNVVGTTFDYTICTPTPTGQWTWSVNARDAYGNRSTDAVRTFSLAPTVIVPPPDVSITKTASASPVTSNGEVTYTITVQNATGTMDALNVTITDPLDDRLSYKSCTTGQGGGCSLLNGIATATFPLLAGGAGATFTITATAPNVTTSTQIPNTATVVAVNEPPANSVNNSASFAVTINPGTVSSGKFGYVANYNHNTVSAYTIDPNTGIFSLVPGSPFSTGSYPDWIAVHPSGHFVYIANGQSSSISAFSVNSSTGILSAIPGSPFMTGPCPSATQVDPRGKFLFVASYCNSSISTHLLDPNTGAVGPPVYTPSMDGNHSIAVDPLGRFIYVTNESSNTLSAFTVNGATGVLSQVNGSPFTTGDVPRSVAIHSSGAFLYVVNNGTTGYAGSASVSAYTVDAGTGSLNPITGSPFPTGVWASWAVIDPTGRFAYVTAAYGVYGYIIDETSGALTLMPNGAPLFAGTYAEGVMDSSGHFLYFVDNVFNSLVGYKINIDTGALSANIGRVPGAGPMFVALTP